MCVCLSVVKRTDAESRSKIETLARCTWYLDGSWHGISVSTKSVEIDHDGVDSFSSIFRNNLDKVLIWGNNDSGCVNFDYPLASIRYVNGVVVAGIANIVSIIIGLSIKI